MGLMSLAIELPVDATFEVSEPDSHGNFFVTARSESFGDISEGEEPVWKLPPGGGKESARTLPKLAEEALQASADNELEA